MIGALATVALLSAIMFTTWALYISLVEHPARLDSGAGPGRAQFRPSYRRAAPWQASFAVVAFAAGTALTAATGRWSWLAGALAIGAVVPFTLVVIKPTNRTLLGGAPLGDGDARRLLERWGRLHAVRTILGGVGVLAFLLALGQR
jgi:Anthrone oxygenase